MFLGKKISLSKAEDNTFGSLDKGGIADLPFLRTLLAISKKLLEPSLVLIAYASVAASRILCNDY